jgi:hypothetical protein
MKAKTLIACAVTASALPLAAAFAQNAEPSGPQGTGWYGAPNAATPIPQGEAGAQWRADNPYRTDNQYQYRMEQRTDAYAEPRVRDRERMTRRDRMAYNGFSADTNPPAPPQ